MTALLTSISISQDSTITILYISRNQDFKRIEFLANEVAVPEFGISLASLLTMAGALGIMVAIMARVGRRIIII